LDTRLGVAHGELGAQLVGWLIRNGSHLLDSAGGRADIKPGACGLGRGGHTTSMDELHEVLNNWANSLSQAELIELQSHFTGTSEDSDAPEA